ncbi:MAG: formamidopyrimidine-DNA glycosylase [Anaerolineae bacterium]|jgi:formamidopyrimidine-DNA glycosylase|nr:formamidopyrimidine-DNA glycosylase [Anaerolineae bacterium]
MPEYPDVVVYIERLCAFAGGRRLNRVRIGSIFVLRTAAPPISAIEGLTLIDVERMGKRLVLVFERDLFLVLHLMISGRLQWHAKAVAIPKKRGLAALDFENGTVMITESSTQKRAALHLVQGRAALVAFDRGGLEVMEATYDAFAAAIRAENHTLKRTLTDPTILSGIGNAYSDEILHHARLSPFLLSRNLNDDQMTRLYEAARGVLAEFTARIRQEAGDSFPTSVTAFRDDMAVHGRYGRGCPTCGTPVQRIQYATNETNYCPVCQTEGRLLADRGLSRLLKDDWPRTLEELEERKSPHREPGRGH